MHVSTICSRCSALMSKSEPDGVLEEQAAAASNETTSNTEPSRDPT